MASSSGETCMASKSKAIVPAYGTASLSQTVDSKDLSNLLKAVGLPKIQSSHGYNTGFYKWYLKLAFEFEIEVEHGFNNINPWEVIRKYYPENWYFTPKNILKPQDYYQSILEETGSVKVKHNFDKNHKEIIAYSSIQIKSVMHPKDWPAPSLYTEIAFKKLKRYSTSYNYFDYVDAWTNIFSIQNPTTTHSWLIYFDQQAIKTFTKFPNWFFIWWQSRGTTEDILSQELLHIYQYFKTNYRPPQNEKYIPPLMYFCINFFLPWVYQWYFDFQYVTDLNIPVIVKKHKIKWWGSFRNPTTEETVKQWIIKKAQFPETSYAGKLTMQGEPTFGAQKAQCQAMLAAAKTPEEYKLICQKMFNQLSSGASVKPEDKQSSSRESSVKSSSKSKIKKKVGRRKTKKQSSSEAESTASSSTSSSDKNSTSSHYDSNEDDCYGILPPVKIRSKTGKGKGKKTAKVKKEKEEKLKHKSKKKDTSSSSSDSE
ncbi:hypothetical protein MANES_05G118701v8 [Manihot esculenta]|uniref:Uncharacterized protein n=2 Tax=Manihot esculenta TaxID=3983 RepID=A0ACB7HQP9_MANES|nr:hypothetical protein MANES_05G118701v8 [Manihot esculenta]